MKKIFLFYFIVSFISDVISQDFKRSLPRVGDLHYTCKTTDSPELFLFKKNNDVWNFNFISSYFCLNESYENASKGKHFSKFPKAEFVIKSSNNFEEYFSNKSASLYSLGKVLEVGFLKSNQLVINYTQPKRIFKGDIMADKSITNVYTLQCKIARNDFITPVNIIPEKADSLMIEVFLNESNFKYDEGILLFNASSRHTQRQEISIEAKYKFSVKNNQAKNWRELASVSLKDFPTELQDLLKQPDSRVAFVSNEYKGATITYNVTNGKVSDLIFQDSELSISSLNLSAQGSYVLALPNPSFGETTLYLLNLPFDNYIFEVTNLVGKKVLTKKLEKKDGKEIQLDLTTLKKGTYIYRIINSKGEKLVTKRLVITSI